MKLEGKVAVVTGGGRGIGKAISIAFANEGAHLVLAARTETELESTAAECKELGAKVSICQMDVTDPIQVDKLVGLTLEQFSALDIIVNNAGIIGPVSPLQTVTIQDWQRTIDVNLTGIFHCCKSVVPVMLNQGHGKIINMSGRGGRHMIAYGATKEAVVYLTETLALELIDDNIQVNAISPGSIHTRMWEETRDFAKIIGDEDLYETGLRVTTGGGASIESAAALVVFLASPASDKLNGRLLRAYSDDFESLGSNIDRIINSDTFTMRRVEL